MIPFLSFSLKFPVRPEMVGHLHLQSMEESLKGKSREGLLDSPDSGLPPSPSPPFCPLSPAAIEHHGYWRKESREGKLVSIKHADGTIYHRINNNKILQITIFITIKKYFNFSLKLHRRLTAPPLEAGDIRVRFIRVTEKVAGSRPELHRVGPSSKALVTVM